MMRILTGLVLGAFVLSLTAPALLAKRTPPPYVPLVVIGNLEFRASTTRPGCIEARDTRTHETWWRQIYVIVYDAAEEKDVQEVFIKRMTAVEGSLRIVNERGDEYTMDIETLAVKALKGSIMLKARG